MVVKPLLTAAAMVGAMSCAARADNVRASDPQSFVNFFFDAGYPAQLTEDAVGDPLIEFRHNGVVMPLWFYDCTDNTACQSVQFYAAYSLDAPLAFEKLNDWNGEMRRFTRAYRIDDDNLVRLEMDVFTGADGLSPADFQSLLTLWLDRVPEFEAFIGW